LRLVTSRKQHPAELRERAVAMVFELRAEAGSTLGSLASVGHKLDINPETRPATTNRSSAALRRVLEQLTDAEPGNGNGNVPPGICPGDKGSQHSQVLRGAGIPQPPQT